MAFIRILVFIVALWAATSPIAACAKHTLSTARIEIKQGAQTPICQGIRDLLNEAGNRGYLIDPHTAASLSNPDIKHHMYGGRQIALPKKRHYALFSEPEWTDIPDEDARHMFPQLIKFSSQSVRHLGKDYKFQKSSLDLLGHGRPEAFYRQIGRGYNALTMDENATSALAQFVNKQRGSFTPGQVLLYDSRPFILYRSSSSSLIVWRLSDTHGPIGFGTGSVCQISATSRKIKG